MHVLIRFELHIIRQLDAARLRVSDHRGPHMMIDNTPEQFWASQLAQHRKISSEVKLRKEVIGNFKKAKNTRTLAPFYLIPHALRLQYARKQAKSHVEPNGRALKTPVIHGRK